MARFMVKASEYKNVCKAVNDRKLAELKKEIIEILKKQDEKEVKKAVDYFNSQELHYSHLEKSFNGKWIEKAGYGVGTVRIWKGKKYKKIAPGKWARVFEKEGRGTNIAIGKLIAKVQKIDNVEDLMAFVMQNKQRFVDENGVDLPVLDKLRAAVDSKNNGAMGNPDYPFKPKTEKERAERAAFEKDRDEFIERMDKIRQENKKKDSKPAEKTGSVEDYKKQIQDVVKEELVNQKEDVARYYEIKQRGLSGKHAEGLSLTKKDKETSIDDRIQEAAEWLVDHPQGNPKSIGKMLARIELAKEFEKNPNWRYGESEEEKPADTNESDYVQKKREAKEGYWSDEFKERNMNNIKQKIASMKEDGASDKKVKAYLEETIETNSKDIPWRENAIKEGRVQGNQANDYRDTIQERTVRIENCKELLKEYESEAEKTQNRSDAMKGNKNAYKGGSEKVELGTFTKIDDKTVEMPSDKVSKQLFENLNKSRSGDNTREFMTDCYYDGENIVSTDGKRMTVIKAENIGLEPGYVSVKTDGGKIRLESIEKKDLRTSFPNYKGVMPTKNNQEVKFDNKALTEKLKEMKKEGKYTKAEPQIALEFEDGKVMLDGVQIGSADGVKFNDSDQRMVINANFLKDALTSGDTSSMFVSDNPNKAMVIRTDVSDSVVMPYQNTIKTEYEVHPDKAGSDTESKPDIKSMSNDDLKEYEAKLEKELLEMGNRNSPDYMKKYSEWREVHAENNDRFHQEIEDEARAEKQKEADAKAEKEKEIKEKYNGYFDNRSGLDKARDVKLLEKKYNFDGKVMSQKDFVEQAIDGGAEIKEREVNKLDYPSRTRWNRMNGYEQEQYERRIKEAGKKTLYSINGFEFPKSVVDYAKYYKENGKKGSGNEKSSLSDVGIKNKASSIASAVSYSKDYQKKMGVPFSLETAEVSVDDADDMDEVTKKAVKEELRRIYDEKKVKKSLFDDFIIDVFEADEDEEIEDAIKFDETEYNDYSAEQPELFNSVEFAVREALNRRHNCIM